MVGDADVQPTIPVSELDEATRFYGGVLGLSVVNEEEHMVVYRSGECSGLQIYQSDNAGSNKGTSATWEVDDIEQEVEYLKKQDVVFEKYEAITGAEVGSGNSGSIYELNRQRAAWFRDPDGNILCLHQTM